MDKDEVSDIVGTLTDEECRSLCRAVLIWQLSEQKGYGDIRFREDDDSGFDIYWESCGESLIYD